MDLNLKSKLLSDVIGISWLGDIPEDLPLAVLGSVQIGAEGFGLVG